MKNYFTNLAFLFLLLCLLVFLNPSRVYAEDYYFLDEFNEERTNNTLDSNKWVVYPNNILGFATVRETGGNLITNQLPNTKQFPLVVSKNAIPSGDFSAEVKFKYTNITYWGTGIVFSKTAPINGSSNTGLFNIDVWQDKSTPNMRIEYRGQTVYRTTLNLNSHIFKVELTGQKYKLYLDGELIYTSVNTSDRVKFIWMGNPIIANPPIPTWTSFMVDYVRVKSTSPKPFLDLPWDYEAKNLTFNEAALAINSYFDHEYPLLSGGIGEPYSSINQITTFLNEDSATKSYSSHDGYDYGTPAQVKINDWVLAAASGSATLVTSCRACGNMLVIDHGNGYQTRYLHLQRNDLVATESGQTVQVDNRQKIGKVGATGNVYPPGDAGAHIHFGVFHDKDSDGNFDNNIPDGATDPFGWQSNEADPWENYTFYYNGADRTGSRSHYLWKTQIDNLDETLTSNGGVFSISRYSLVFQSGTTSQNLNILLKSTPIAKPSSILQSIGSTIIITASDFFGNLVTQFNNFYTITVDFDKFDLSRFKQDTISFYSSNDGINWVKETTVVDLSNKTASTQVNHMTHFALMAERFDANPPITTPVLEGGKGQESWFRSDVILSLNAQDNQGGLGVDYTLYRIGDNDWEVYNKPLEFTEEEDYNIDFYSVDLDENIEDLQTVKFSIDKTPPRLFLDANPKSLWSPDNKLVDVQILGYAYDEHVYRNEFKVQDEYNILSPEITEFGQVIQLDAKRFGNDLDGREYIIKVVSTDLANNKNEKEVTITVQHDQRLQSYEVKR